MAQEGRGVQLVPDGPPFGRGTPPTTTCRSSARSGSRPAPGRRPSRRLREAAEKRARQLQAARQEEERKQQKLAELAFVEQVRAGRVARVFISHAYKSHTVEWEGGRSFDIREGRHDKLVHFIVGEGLLHQRTSSTRARDVYAKLAGGKMPF